jgi:hypothetical protein
MPLITLSKGQHGTSTSIMNMSSSRSTASTISTFFNPIKKKLGLKKSSRGTNALYRAISGENWDIVITVCDTKPYKAEKWHNAVGFFDAHRSSKILPLHQACIFHPTPEAIRAIVQAYPYALRAKESGYGRVPLHIACHSNASFECICELLKSYPAGSLERDSIGRVPLHYALSNGAAEEVVEKLLNAAVESHGESGRRQICSATDFNGWLPIHVACFMGASARVLSMLVKAYPEGVDAETKKKSTPTTLLNGISLSPQKKSSLEAVLLRSRSKVKKQFSAAFARTDIVRVTRMSDETCSRGVTLEIDEDETSSLSSMEETATVRTARGVEKRSKQLQFGYEGKKVETISQQPISPAKNRSNASSLQLPTHNVYKNSEQSSSSNIRSINQPAHPYEQIERQKGPSNGLNRRSSTRSNIPSAQASASSSDNTSSNRNRDVAIFEPIHSSGTFC